MLTLVFYLVSLRVGHPFSVQPIYHTSVRLVYKIISMSTDRSTSIVGMMSLAPAHAF